LIGVLQSLYDSYVIIRPINSVQTVKQFFRLLTWSTLG